VPDRFVFVGVTTGESSMVRIFPRWREALGLGDVVLDGWDVPLDAPPATHRDVVRRLREEPGIVGALITTHKIDVARAGADLFDELDDHARRLGEVSAVGRRGGRLLGWATDPLTAARVMEALPGPFPEVLCMGAGGAGTAIVGNLTSPRIVVTDRDPRRLERLHSLYPSVERAPADDNDRLLESLAPGSLAINATGLGKDRPGSPISDAARFPERAVAWELNYRGDLRFLEQARAQGVTVEDGWRYFVVGWAAVIEKVFARRLTTADVDLLDRIATASRGPRRRAR
jgi:shikimate 5-dehydrogenase